MRRIVEVNGDSARYLGGSVYADLVRKSVTDEQVQSQYFDGASEESAPPAAGTAAEPIHYGRDVRPILSNRCSQ